MSTLKTNNLEHLDAPSPNIALGIGGGVNISGIATAESGIRVSSGSSIGVGTDAPEEYLNIFASSGTDAAIQLQTTTIDVNKARISKENTGELKITSSLGSSGRAIVFETKGSDQKERMRIKADGEVGIGTDSTTALLHVEKDGTSENIARFAANTGTYTNRFFTIVSPETDHPNEPFTFLTGNSFQFKCDTHVGIKIDDDGLVGIATTVPATALSVAGDVRVQNSSDATQYLTINYQGIDFQNTGAGSSTAATSHLLDDYEEGTFTPTITDCTSYTTQRGYYVKVGRLVHFTLRVQPTAGSGSASGLSIGGLPFTNTSIASGPYGGAFSVYGALVDRNSIPNLVWFISTNDNKIIARSETSQIATNNSAVSLTGNYLYVGSYYTA